MSKPFSLRSLTILIFVFLGIIIILLSHLASKYTQQAALDAQTNSLIKVIEVASTEVLKKVRLHNQDLAMKLAYDKNILAATIEGTASENYERLTSLIDDPFIHGFVGFSKVNLAKIRIYDNKLKFLAQSNQGLTNIGQDLAPHTVSTIYGRSATDRLKSISTLWNSPEGPLYSTIVPLGGLRPVGYLEVISDPAFNLPEIGDIIQSPLKVFSVNNQLINANEKEIPEQYLPIHFTLKTSSGIPAFNIIAYENIATLSHELNKSLKFIVSVFLTISLISLLVSLAIFSRLLINPLTNMIKDINQVRQGKYDQKVNEKGLKEFNVLARTFNAMTDQLLLRTDSLHKLLDMNPNALLYFDTDNTLVYCNKKATELLGYEIDEVLDLDITDLFIDSLEKIRKEYPNSNTATSANLKLTLQVKHKSGKLSEAKALIHVNQHQKDSSFAIAIEPTANQQPHTNTPAATNTEQALSSLTAIAGNNRAFMRRSTDFGDSTNDSSLRLKSRLREQAVKVMNGALSCWSYDLNKNKIELAEESGIWPVYIDKSTPTTRTLDKYLNISQCPKHPRIQRVIDTAEFVIKSTNQLESSNKTELQQSLKDLQQLAAGL